MVNAATLAGMTSPVYVPTSQEIAHLIETVETSAKEGDGYADLTAEPILALCDKYTFKIDACNTLLAALPVTGGGVWGGPSIEKVGNTPTAIYRVNVVTHPLYVSLYKRMENSIQAALLSAAAQGYHSLILSGNAPPSITPPYYQIKTDGWGDSAAQVDTVLVDAKNELQANGYAVQRAGDRLEVSW